jgi:hypothetical protein
VTPRSLVLAYLGVGDRDEVFRLLERSWRDRDEEMIYINVDPKMRELRDDPRFHRLLRKLHLEG